MLHLVIVLWLATRAALFNMDATRPLVLTGNKKSQFGFSVAIWPNFGEPLWVDEAVWERERERMKFLFSKVGSSFRSVTLGSSDPWLLVSRGGPTPSSRVPALLSYKCHHFHSTHLALYWEAWAPQSTSLYNIYFIVLKFCMKNYEFSIFFHIRIVLSRFCLTI